MIFLFYKKLIADGGAERLLIEEYLAFKRLGLDVSLVTFEYDSNLGISKELCEKDIKILKSKFWLLSLYKLFRLLRSNLGVHCIVSSGYIECYFAGLYSKVKFYCRQHHPTSMDTKNTNKYSFFRSSEYAAILKRTNEVKWIESKKYEVNTWHRLYFSLKDILETKFLKRAKNVFVLSEYAKFEHELIYSGKSEVIQGALRHTSPKYVLVQQIRQSKGFKVLSVSRLEPQKRLDKALTAFSKFLKFHTDAKFYIGGKGPEEIFLRKLAYDLNIEKSVVFLGFISDELLLDYYGSADVFINLDWADFNITVYEALSAGTFVITSDEGEFDEVLVEKNYITKVNPHHLEGIEEALESFSQRTLLFDQEEVSGRLEAYTWDNFCRSTLHFLQ
jgi:glycosyltransferase involved in cell wall biosynthesis